MKREIKDKNILFALSIAAEKKARNKKGSFLGAPILLGAPIIAHLHKLLDCSAYIQIFQNETCKTASSEVNATKAPLFASNLLERPMPPKRRYFRYFNSPWLLAQPFREHCHPTFIDWESHKLHVYKLYCVCWNQVDLEESVTRRHSGVFVFVFVYVFVELNILFSVIFLRFDWILLCDMLVCICVHKSRPKEWIIDLLVMINLMQSCFFSNFGFLTWGS